MKNKSKTWVHLILWAVMILYLFIAPAIKDRTTIVYGQPATLAVNLPVPTSVIRFDVEKLQPYKVGKQYLHLASGWTLIDQKLPQADFEKYLVLSSDSGLYFFPTSSHRRVDIESAYPEVAADLSDAGFYAHIAGDSMRNGLYRVGFLYKELSTGAFTYQLSGQYVEKTHNFVRLKGE